MSEYETKNMKITGASISMADHGVLTFYIDLEGDGCAVSFGSYVIGKDYLGAKEFSGCATGIECLMRIMDTIGVERWEDLKGKYVRMVDPGLGGVVTTIGNIIKDKWFNAKEFFESKSE